MSSSKASPLISVFQCEDVEKVVHQFRKQSKEEGRLEELLERMTKQEYYLLGSLFLEKLSLVFRNPRGPGPAAPFEDTPPGNTDPHTPSPSPLKAPAPSTPPPEPTEPSPIPSDHLKLLKCICKTLSSLISLEKVTAPVTIYKSLCILHDSMALLGDSRSAKGVQVECVRCFERWFLQDRDGKEAFVPQMISFLILRTFEPDVQEKDIKRINPLLEALRLIDFTTPASKPLKELLLRTVIHNPFLKSKSGVKTLVFLFTLHSSFISDLHNTIKAALVLTKPWIIDTYALIYFKAWKSAVGMFRTKIENDCIQDLIYHSIHLADKKLLVSVQTILAYFHHQKLKLKHIDGMLVRLYEPILWRSFTVANPEVRKNALQQFSLAFPMLSDEWSTAQIEESLEQQYNHIKNLIQDPSPVVRQEVPFLICRMIVAYYDFISPQTSKYLLSSMIDTLCYDKSSPEVRASAMKASKMLLSNVQCKPLKKIIFQRLPKVMHDTSESVRSAVIELLLLAQEKEWGNWWEIVELEQVVVRLGMERGAKIQSLLIKLLKDTFFPVQRKKSSNMISRCISMINMSPLAAIIFYGQIHKEGDWVSVAKFMLELWIHCAASWLEVRFSDVADKKKKNKFLNESDVQTATTVINLIATIWDTLKHNLSLKKNNSLAQLVLDTFNTPILEIALNSKHEDPALEKALLRLAGHIPRHNYKDNIKEVARKITPDTGDEQLWHIIKVLFGWKSAHLISAKVIEALETQEEPKKKRKHAKDKGVEKSSGEGIMFGLKIIGLIMGDSNFLEKFMKLDNFESLLQALGAISTSAENCIQNSVEEFDRHTDIKALSIGHLYYHRLLLLHKPKKQGSIIKKLLDWIESTLVPLFKKMDNDEGDKEESLTKNEQFLSDIVHNMIALMSDYVVLDLAESPFIEPFLKILLDLIQVLSKSKNSMLTHFIIQTTLKFIHHLYDDNTNVPTELCTQIINTILQTVPPESLKTSFHIAPLFAVKHYSIDGLISLLFKKILASIPVPDQFPSTINYIEEIDTTSGLLLSMINHTAAPTLSLFEYLDSLTQKSNEDWNMYWKNLEESDDGVKREGLVGVWCILQVCNLIWNLKRKEKKEEKISSLIKPFLLKLVSREYVMESQAGLTISMLRDQVDTMLQETEAQ